MQITNDYVVNNFFDAPFATQPHRKYDNNHVSASDTVSISDAALQAYVNSKATSIENENNSDNNASEQFRNQFNSYRGNGIFSEDESVNRDGSAEDTGKIHQTEEEKISKTVSELERKVKDLTEKLGAIMSSSMPEHEKDAMANQIYKELEELQSQLNAYKQAEKALASAS